MPLHDKAKNVGRYIVILLCFAIVFFLLLPFLEEAATPSAQHADKKATPQIFTPNPLSELVNKIYSLFSKNQKRNQARQAILANDTAANTQAAIADIQPPRYAAEDGTDNIVTAATATPSTAYQPQTYNYGNAGFINEEGEWVLVRQTAPDASQRGMHEINTSDSPYDKLVRLERAAKYNTPPAPAQPPIPDSKWARLFHPIKTFFGFGSKPKQAPTQKAFALADASDGMDRSLRRPTGRFARPGAVDMSVFASSSPSGTAGQIDFAWSDIFNPGQILDGVVENLKQMGNSISDMRQRSQFNKRLNALTEEQRQFIKDSFYIKMQLNAQKEPADDFLSKTFACGQAVSGTYSGQKDSVPCLLPRVLSQQEVEQMAQQSNQEAQKNHQESLKQLALMSDKRAPTAKDMEVKMVVLLGKADKTNPFETYSRAPLPTSAATSEEELAALQQENKDRQRQDENLRRFYDFMIEEQGCASKDCYAIGSATQADPSMANRIISSGVQYDGDPLQLSEGMIERFAQQQQAQAQTEEEKEKAQHIQEDLQNFPPYYIYYTDKDMAQLNKRNVSPAPNKPPEQPFLYYIPSAGNAAALPRTIIPAPGVVFYGGGVLDEDHTTMKQAGDTLRNMYIQRAEEAKALARQALKNVTDSSFPALLQQGDLPTLQQLIQINQQDLDSAS